MTDTLHNAGNALVEAMEPYFDGDIDERGEIVGAIIETMSELGFVIVPKKITLKMQHAYFGVIDKNLERVSRDATFGRYASQEEAWSALISESQVGVLQDQ